MHALAKVIVKPATVRFQAIFGPLTSVAKYPIVWVWRRDRSTLQAGQSQKVGNSPRLAPGDKLKTAGNDQDES